MTKNASAILGLLTLFIAYAVFRAASDIPRVISSQGCRMSWMSPSYLLQSDFNTSWTPLASRYSLWLYREVGWEPNQPMGLPILFIPGNAGSSHQVRSIASSAARQYFSTPFVVSHEFTRRKAKPIDFYAVEFNEDLSAFHGSTLDSQIAYSSAAVEYILSRYPPNTNVVVMGHSMGGIVGAALLPSGNITALITMSTPHTLPPARFDARIEAIYDRNRKTLSEDTTPILSICGGATDMMIPSESCVLPAGKGYRRTVFTSALEGAWTGVGHREMVWCHQVRWRVARVALELGTAGTPGARARVLDQWLRDANVLPLLPDGDLRDEFLEGYDLAGDSRVIIDRPIGKRTYLLPIPGEDSERRTLRLYVSQGSVLDVGPRRASDLHVSVHRCAGVGVSCEALAPTLLTLLPGVIPGKSFPVPDEGADESEGVVFYEAEIPNEAQGWVAITVDGGEDGRGWVAGRFEQTRNVENAFGLRDLVFHGIKLSLPRSDVGMGKTDIRLPRLPATALLVYRFTARTQEYASCTAPLFSPLLVHTSQASERHYYRLATDEPVFLHTHASAPYVPLLRPAPSHGVNLTIHTFGSDCQDVVEVRLSIDWWASVGRVGTRYLTTLLSWGVGIVSLLLFRSWCIHGQKLDVGDSLDLFVKQDMPTLMVAAGVMALLPLGPDYYLGIGDELGVLRVVLAVLFVGMAAGMVCVTWWLLVVLMWPLGLLKSPIARCCTSTDYLGGANDASRRRDDGSVRRRTAVSMAVVLAVISVFVPWQVAFLGCWVTQLLHCGACARRKPYPGSVPTVSSTPTNQVPVDEHGDGSPDVLKPTFGNTLHQNRHLLLLMTWLLPLVAPVLVVWVRTVQTAGYIPFSGDHNVFKVAPVVLMDLTRGRSFDVAMGWLRWGWVVIAGTAFVVGGRRVYVVYDAANVQMAIVVLCHMTAWLIQR